MNILGYEIGESDILLVKKPREVDDDDFRERLAMMSEYLQEQGVRCTVFGVEEFEDLQLLSVANMNSVKWFHESQIETLKEGVTFSDEGPYLGQLNQEDWDFLERHFSGREIEEEE